MLPRSRLQDITKDTLSSLSLIVFPENEGGLSDERGDRQSRYGNKEKKCTKANGAPPC